MSISAVAYLADPKKMSAAIGSNDPSLAAKAAERYDAQYDGFLFAPQSPGVDYSTALGEVLAGGPYQDGLASQYVYGLYTVVQALCERRLNDSWGEGLGARWMSDPLDRLIGEAGSSFRFENTLFRDQEVYGIPASDEWIAVQISPLEASRILLDTEGVVLADPECQETLEGFVGSCREVAESEYEMIIFYM